MKKKILEGKTFHFDFIQQFCSTYINSLFYKRYQTEPSLTWKSNSICIKFLTASVWTQLL